MNSNSVSKDSNCFNHRPWIMKIKLLWLREKFYWKLFSNKIDRFASLFDNATLEFAPRISLNLMQTDVSHKMIAFCGFYELPVSRCIAKLAKTDGLMVDVGANYGYYSCLWAGAGNTNQVVAFEASPRNISALKHNILKNGLENQIEMHETAVGKERGYLFFDLGPQEQSGWGGLIDEEKSDAVKVPVISLDEFFSKWKY